MQARGWADTDRGDRGRAKKAQPRPWVTSFHLQPFPAWAPEVPWKMKVPKLEVARPCSTSAATQGRVTLGRYLCGRQPARGCRYLCRSSSGKLPQSCRVLISPSNPTSPLSPGLLSICSCLGDPDGFQGQLSPQALPSPGQNFWVRCHLNQDGSSISKASPANNLSTKSVSRRGGGGWEGQ